MCDHFSKFNPNRFKINFNKFSLVFTVTSAYRRQNDHFLAENASRASGLIPETLDFGGEREIRTLGRVLAYTRFPGVGWVFFIIFILSDIEFKRV